MEEMSLLLCDWFASACESVAGVEVPSPADELMFPTFGWRRVAVDPLPVSASADDWMILVMPRAETVVAVGY